MNAKPTPETDARTYIPTLGAGTVIADFARKLERERDEAIADRDILRINAQREAEHHDRMVAELERVYKERDEAREDLEAVNALEEMHAKPGSMEIAIKQNPAQAQWVAKCFASMVAASPNYTEMKFDLVAEGEKWEWITVLIQKGNGKTPHQLRQEAEKERDEAREKLERQAERIRHLEGATNHACGTPFSVALRERDEARKFLREATKQRDGALEELEVRVKERNEARKALRQILIETDGRNASHIGQDRAYAIAKEAANESCY